MSKAQPMSKGAQRRADVLRIARSHLIERGYDAFSMREIASEAGTKLGHIQYYFPTRHDLLEALVREEFTMNLAEIGKIVKAAPAGRARLEGAVRALVGLWLSEGARVYVVMPFLALHDSRFRELNTEINEAFYKVVAELLAAMNPGLPARELDSRARLITAIMDGGLLHAEASPGLVEDIVRTVLLVARQTPP